MPAGARWQGQKTGRERVQAAPTTSSSAADGAPAEKRACHDVGRIYALLRDKITRRRPKAPIHVSPGQVDMQQPPVGRDQVVGGQGVEVRSSHEVPLTPEIPRRGC